LVGGGQRGVWTTTALSDGGRAQRVTKVIDLEGEHAVDARVRQAALIGVGDRLTRVGPYHGMAVGSPRLQPAQTVVLLGDQVRMFCLRAPVEPVCRLPPHPPAQGTYGFPLLSR
jgi:hypothetical protein